MPRAITGNNENRFEFRLMVFETIILLSSPRSGGLNLARRFNAESMEPCDSVA